MGEGALGVDPTALSIPGRIHIGKSIFEMMEAGGPAARRPLNRDDVDAPIAVQLRVILDICLRAPASEPACAG